MLTEKQSVVLTAIRGHVAKHRRAPTLGYLCEVTGTVSAGSMHKHVEALIAQGYAERDKRGGVVPSENCPCCGKKW